MRAYPGRKKQACKDENIEPDIKWRQELSKSGHVIPFQREAVNIS
jgi:hypothetical protein